jgi:hypothetical protein
MTVYLVISLPKNAYTVYIYTHRIYVVQANPINNTPLDSDAQIHTHSLDENVAPTTHTYNPQPQPTTHSNSYPSL